MESFLRKVITLNDSEKWYICDETLQNNDKYYLALQLDNENNVGEESKIFKEVVDGDDVYLDDKIDANDYANLTAVFITNFNNNSDKIIEELNSVVIGE